MFIVSFLWEQCGEITDKTALEELLCDRNMGKSGNLEKGLGHVANKRNWLDDPAISLLLLLGWYAQ